MNYDFDEVIDRHGTDSIKYDFHLERGVPLDAKPFWVADMDFRTAPCVIDAIKERTEHGIFGYTDVKPHYADAVISWYESRFGYAPNGKSLVVTPGVVSAICMAIQAFTNAGDGVLIQPPVYYPFRESIAALGRTVIENPLAEHDGHYEMNYADMEKKIVSGKVRLFILCSPHNPVGRVWTQGELERAAGLCARYGVKVFADEIHCDFTYPPNVHTPFPSLSPAAAAMTVWGTAPTKTFNLAGLQVSNIFIEDNDMRSAFQKAMASFGYSQPNTLGLAAAEAAYKDGGEWFDALRAYIKTNIGYAVSFLKHRHLFDTSLPGLQGIKAAIPEGTYLLWLDCRGMGLSPDALDEVMLKKSRLWLDGGAMFGTGGAGFQRMNIACPRSTLAEGLASLP